MSNMILIMHQELQYLQNTTPPQNGIDNRAPLKTYTIEATNVTLKKTIQGTYHILEAFCFYDIIYVKQTKKYKEFIFFLATKKRLIKN